MGKRNPLWRHNVKIGTKLKYRFIDFCWILFSFTLFESASFPEIILKFYYGLWNNYVKSTQRFPIFFSTNCRDCHGSSKCFEFLNWSEISVTASRIEVEISCFVLFGKQGENLPNNIISDHMESIFCECWWLSDVSNLIRSLSWDVSQSANLWITFMTFTLNPHFVVNSQQVWQLWEKSTLLCKILVEFKVLRGRFEPWRSVKFN